MSSVNLASAGKDDEETESEIKEVPPKSTKKCDFVPVPRKPSVAPQFQPETPKRKKRNNKRVEKDEDHSDSESEEDDENIQENAPCSHRKIK